MTTRGRFGSAASLALLATMASCGGGDVREELEQRWSAVVGSASAAEEAEAVTDVRDLLTEEGVAFRVVVIDAEGNEIPYAEFKGQREIKALRFTFLKDDGALHMPEWSPKDEENLYALFRE